MRQVIQLSIFCHTSDPATLKKALENTYTFDFTEATDILKNIRKNRNDNKNHLPGKEADRVMIKDIAKLALTLCDDILPCNEYNFFGKDNHDLFFSDDLLNFLIMDSFVAVNKKLFDDNCNSTTKISNEYYHNSLQTFHVSIAKGKTGYTSFAKSAKKSLNNFWIKELGITRADGDYTTIKIPKYLDKTIGLLIKSIGKNPYFLKDDIPGQKRFSNLTLKQLKDFFLNSLYDQMNQSKPEDPYDFTYRDKAERACAYYYLDSLYDFDSMLYIAIKLNNRLTNIDENRKSEVIKVLYQCILIPNRFSKRDYIDTMFNVLALDEASLCPYKEYRTKDALLAELLSLRSGNINAIRQENLIKCREYIMYLSKIYLPVLSACFYVFLHEVLTTKAVRKLLKSLVETDILPYYEERNQQRKEEFKLLKADHDTYLAQLYDTIRNNIYRDEEVYSDICNSLKIESEFTPKMRSYILNQIIDTKLTADLSDLNNPIPNEKTNDRPFSLHHLLQESKELILRGKDVDRAHSYLTDDKSSE